MDALTFLLGLVPDDFYKWAGVGQQWPLPDEELGLVIDERKN